MEKCSNILIARKYLSHWFRGRNKKGFGVHSPFLFHLITEVIHDYTPFYCFDEIEKERKKLIENKSIITVTDFGAGSRIFKSNERKISDIAKTSLKPAKQAQLLFRLINYFSSKNILELGTSLGVTTCYLAKVSKKSKIITLEGCKSTSEKAHAFFNRLKIENIIIKTGDFKETLLPSLKELQPLDFVFFDGNHSEQATLQYFNTCLPFVNNNTIFIFDDIHLNKGMEKAWNNIINSDKVKGSLDLFHMGIVFFKKELTKEHFKVRF